MSEPIICPVCGRPAVRLIEDRRGQTTLPLQHIKCVFELLARTCETCRHSVTSESLGYPEGHLGCAKVYEGNPGSTVDLFEEAGYFPAMPPDFACNRWEPKP